MTKYLIVGCFLLAGVLFWCGTSCSTPPAGSASNAQIFLNISNDSGCNVVATLDGNNPVTNTANGGPYTLYSNLTIGHHVIGIDAYKNSSCSFDINGGNQTCNLDHPCDSSFTLSCF